MRNALVSVAAKPPPLLPADATDAESSDDADECVFVFGTQSYTLKSMRRNDTDAGAAAAGAVTGFLTILNFLICVVYPFLYSLFQF
jgi:hypothetical protein